MMDAECLSWSELSWSMLHRFDKELWYYIMRPIFSIVDMVRLETF